MAKTTNKAAEKPKSKRGGSRQGAGRKPVTKPTVKSKPVQTTVKKKEPTRGILLLALGSPQYGRMAANLAASICFNDKSIPIHVVHTEGSLSHLTDAHKKLFTSTSVCPAEYINHDGKVNYFRAKTFVYELSPFDETIVMDVDLVLFGGKSIKGLFDEMSVNDFDMQSRGHHDYNIGTTVGKYTFWFDIKEAKQKYHLENTVHQLSSEVFFFRKNAAMKKFFKLVRSIYDNPKAKPSMSFSGSLPDEYAFNIASSITGNYPSATRTFIYWHFMDGHKVWKDLISQYLGYSVGGNKIPQQVKIKYEQLCSAQATALKLPYAFKVYAKSKWDETRKNL